MEYRIVLFSILLLVLLQEAVARAIQLKDAEPDSVKRNVRLGLVLGTGVGNGRLNDLRHKAIPFTNNKAALTERKVDALSRRGQKHNGVEEPLSTGVFRRVLENACSTENGALLGTICRKQKLSKKGWGNPSSIPWIN